MQKQTDQHDNLRKRLEAELAHASGAPGTGEYDWFFRSKSSPQTPVQQPNVALPPKAKPTTLQSNSELVNRNGEEFMVELKRSKTADAKLNHSRTLSGTSNSNSLHRTSTNVATSNVGVVPKQQKVEPVKKKGFFKKLFGGAKDDIVIPTTPQNKVSTPQSKVSTTPSRKSVDISEGQRTHSSSFSLTSSDRNALMLDKSLTSTSSIAKKVSPPLSEQYKSLDSQLSAYLKELEDYSHNGDPLFIEKDEQLAKIFSATSGKKIEYEHDIVPPHPDKPRWPSAFSSKPRFGGSIEKEIFIKNKKKEAEQQAGSMFGSLLHKTKTESPEWLLLNGALNESEDTPPFTFQPVNYTHPPPKADKKPPLKTLSDVKQMKKVAFATTTFVYDPPQQIPSRNPRKGNVELMENGELLIHKVDPQDKMNSATGIVVGGTGHLKLVATQQTEKMHSHDGNIIPSSAMQKTGSTTSMSSFDHTIRTEDKDAAALKAREKHGSDDKIDLQKEAITIDKPMFKRKRPMDKPVVTLKMDELYTRCCHLREILPIPATLKQIPKGSIDPIPYLHLRNPRPSMIEIWSLTDFIRISPLICMSFDGVTLTHEMFKIILSSLLYKRFLEKLSLRNTPIDNDGWKMLSYFLSMNRALKRLDITQCHLLDVHTQRIKSSGKISNEVRMTCNINDRSDMDWALFTASIIFRGGLDELILTGCKIPDIKLFSNLLNMALPKVTKLGLAYNDLTDEHCEIVAKWMQGNDELIGIDLAFNDLSNHLTPFLNYGIHANSKLKMLSLNNCNLLDSTDTRKLFNLISKLPELKYIDLSGNKKLFKTFMKRFCFYLPSLNNLTKLNLDYCDLSTIDLVILLQTIPLMKNLNDISLQGQKLSKPVLFVLTRTLKLSRSLYAVHFDKAEVDTKYQEKIGLLTMRNVERQLYESHDVVQKSILEIVSKLDSESLKKELNLPKGMSFTDYLYNTIKQGDKVDEKEKERVFAICAKLRLKLKGFTSTLMDLHVKRQLNVEGTEILVKLITMDASIAHSLELLGDKSLQQPGQSYEKYLSKIMEKGQSKEVSNNEKSIKVDDELVNAIRQLEKDPVKGKDQFIHAINSAEDPYDIVNLLKELRLNNVNVSDLFVRQINDKEEGDNDTETDGVADEEVLNVYNSILSELSEQRVT